MFDIGLPELMIILVLGLVLLGPDRLPGVIRQVTGVIRQLRSSYSDAIATFKDQLGDVQGDIDAIRGEISSIQGEVRSTAEDVQKDVEEVQGEVKTAGTEIEKGLQATAAEAAATRPDQVGAEAEAPPPAAAAETTARPNLSERGPAWTPQGAQAGGGSPVQQDLFAGLMRSLKARLGDDWLIEQAEIYRDLGTRAAERRAGEDQDIAALVRTWADMHRNSLPDGSLQIIETGRDYRVRMRQCPFSFAETDDVALCESCGAYDLAFLQERAADVKWGAHLTAGDPWCELVFAKPPPPPKPEPVQTEAESKAEPSATANGDGAAAPEDAAQSSAPQEAVASAVDSAAAGSEFGSLAQSYGSTAEAADSPEPAAAETPVAVDPAPGVEAAGSGVASTQTADTEAAAAEASEDGDADGTDESAGDAEVAGNAEAAGNAEVGKKETAP